MDPDGGATRCAFRPGSSSCSVCAALSGLETGWRFFPRALPWAGLFGPFGARTWYLRANLSATNETSPAGCFRFGAREDRMNLKKCKRIGHLGQSGGLRGQGRVPRFA